MNYKKVVDGYLDEQIALDKLKPEAQSREDKIARATVLSLYIDVAMSKAKFQCKLAIPSTIISGVFALAGVGGVLANYLTGLDNSVLTGACVGFAGGALARFFTELPKYVKSFKVCQQYKVVKENWSVLAFCPRFVDDFCKVNDIQFIMDPFEDKIISIKENDKLPLCFPTPEMVGRQFETASLQQAQEA